MKKGGIRRRGRGRGKEGGEGRRRGGGGGILFSLTVVGRLVCGTPVGWARAEGDHPGHHRRRSHWVAHDCTPHHGIVHGRSAYLGVEGSSVSPCSTPLLSISVDYRKVHWLTSAAVC